MSGIVPLMAMIRHRSRAGSDVPTRLLYAILSIHTFSTTGGSPQPNVAEREQSPLMSSKMTLDYEQFDHAHLRRIVPVAQTRVFDQITITVMSLELYEAGFAVNLLHGGAIGDDPHDIHHLLGTPILRITDEDGHEYSATFRAGFGGGGISGGNYRVLSNTHVMQVTPALQPDVGRLSFEMRLVTQMSYHSERGVEYEPSNIVGGPWTFDIVIPPDPSEGLEWPRHGMLTPVPTIDGKLSRVAPVAQRRGTTDASVTVYSLELFEDGFIAVVRVDWVDKKGYSMPRMTWSGWDDLGGEYRNVNRAGGGGGQLPDHRSWRMSFMFRPAIDPDASTLTLEVPNLELVNIEADPIEPGKPAMTVEGTHEGPWTFEIDLWE